MNSILFLCYFLAGFSLTSYAQVFTSDEQYSGTIDEIQDSILRK